MLFENSEISINNFRKIRLIIGNINITYIADFSKNISYNIINHHRYFKILKQWIFNMYCTPVRISVTHFVQSFYFI